MEERVGGRVGEKGCRTGLKTEIEAEVVAWVGNWTLELLGWNRTVRTEAMGISRSDHYEMRVKVGGNWQDN